MGLTQIQSIPGAAMVPLVRLRSSKRARRAAISGASSCKWFATGADSPAAVPRDDGAWAISAGDHIRERIGAGELHAARAIGANETVSQNPADGGGAITFEATLINCSRRGRTQRGRPALAPLPQVENSPDGVRSRDPARHFPVWPALGSGQAGASSHSPSRRRSAARRDSGECADDQVVSSRATELDRPAPVCALSIHISGVSTRSLRSNPATKRELHRLHGVVTAIRVAGKINSHMPPTSIQPTDGSRSW